MDRYWLSWTRCHDRTIRRRDPHRPDRWKIYFGDVDIGPRAGVPSTVDQLEWYCGFVPPAHRGVERWAHCIDLQFRPGCAIGND
jgi:hypothetical protein